MGSCGPRPHQRKVETATPLAPRGPNRTPTRPIEANQRPPAALQAQTATNGHKTVTNGRKPSKTMKRNEKHKKMVFCIVFRIFLQFFAFFTLCSTFLLLSQFGLKHMFCKAYGKAYEAYEAYGKAYEAYCQSV